MTNGELIALLRRYPEDAEAMLGVTTNDGAWTMLRVASVEHDHDARFGGRVAIRSERIHYEIRPGRYLTARRDEMRDEVD